MSIHAEHNRRIALNTIILYGRMAFVMGCGLFTTRALLSALGPVDFGLVNVIAGVVTMFGFLSSSMNTATGRFFSFDLGSDNHERLGKTFGLSRLVFLFLALVVFLLSEGIGLWLLEHKLVIPPERMGAAKWLFHGALLGFLLSMITIPYSSLVIAHENMKLYSKVSLVDALLKLALAISLGFVAIDRLAAYGFILFLIPLVSFLIYYCACRKAYGESRAPFFFDKIRFKEMLSFSGWNLFGALSGVATGALTNILLNVYFGPVVNAARAVAFQVSGAASGLTSGFIQASAPQIVKYYASGDLAPMRTLVCNASRYGFLLLLVGITPLIAEMEFILSLWLGDVPAHTATFSRLALIVVLIDSLSFPLMQAAQATGRIAFYQTAMGSLLIMNLPISYFTLRCGFPAVSVFFIAIVISSAALFARVLFLNRMIGLDVKQFFCVTMMPCVCAAICAVFMTCAFIYLPILSGGAHCVTIVFAVFIGVSSVFTFGLNSGERAAFIRKFMVRLKR